MYSEKTLQKLKSHGVVKLASHYTNLTRVSDSLYVGRCPHPDHNDSVASFRIFIDKDDNEKWACMGCHCGKKNKEQGLFGCDNIAFMQWINSTPKHRVSFIDGVKMLAKFYNEEISEEGIYDAQEKKKKIVYEKNRKTAIKYRLSHTTESFSYLIDRGLTISDINLFNIGYNPESNRITFPIQDKYSNIIGFTNRELSKTDVSGRKYINSRNSDIFIKKASFYGINLLDYEHDYIYITEGVFDVILAKKYGIKNVVCTLGCHLSEEHVKIIKALGKTPVLCYDGDDAGQKGAKSAYELLSSNGVENVQILPLPFNMDLADTANKMKAELKDFVLNNTKSYAKYKIDEITNKLDNIILAAMNEANSNITSLLKNIQSENESIIYKNYANKRLHLWK